MKICDCKSYNRPDLGGNNEEVILKAPEWSGKDTICVDSCISETIQMLWSNGIETRGCCCGHRRENPSVIIAEHVDGNMVKQLLKTDGRKWRVLQWKLVEI